LITWILRPVLTLFASQFLYPEIIHPTLVKVWRSKDWKATKKYARNVVRFYNLDQNKDIPDDEKRALAFAMVKNKIKVHGFEMKDNRIHSAIVMAVESEKVDW
jgi:hypothetical protein